jgi:hypothetical protein
MAEYFRLRESAKFTIKKFKPRFEEVGEVRTVGEVLARIRKGSKIFRNIMSGRGSKVYADFKFETVRPIKTLWEQMGVELDEKLLKCNIALWKIQDLEINFRQFLFKMTQGLVHGNTVISHYGNVDRRCTFCKIVTLQELKDRLGRNPTPQEEVDGMRLVSDEHRGHILWECNITRSCINRVFHELWGVNLEYSKDFLMGRDLGSMELSQLYMVLNYYILYRIWSYKLGGGMPRSGYIINDVRNLAHELGTRRRWRGMLPLIRQRLATP